MVLGCCVHLFWRDLFSQVMRGRKFRDETPPFCSVEPFAHIARNYLHWLEHRRALAGKWFFVELFGRVYRDAVRNSYCRECGLVREHVLHPCMSSILKVTQV